MDAKEISDETLEEITPAADDLLVVYDTSASTTGKATLADIAPVVAENIDIADLSTVTPAADDALMIYDASANTTGKATLADIAPVVAENIDIADLSTVTPAADDALMIYDASEETTGKSTLEQISNIIVNKIYPIGSIYISVNSTPPSTLFDGTNWEQLQDRFLLGAGSDYAAGDTGGEASHALTINEMPSHCHNFNWSGSHSHKRYNTGTDGWAYQVEGSSSSGLYVPGYPDPHNNALPIQSTTITINKNTDNTGAASGHNNMPPYLVVYIWKRIA